jgi:hypothetical protein
MTSYRTTAALLAGILVAHPALARSELLSIRGIALPENGYVAGFSIDLWSVEVLAVCHLPPGWTITAGKSADPSGVLSGKASLGVAFLNLSDLKQLDRLFLIEVEDYHAREKPLPNGVVSPASFGGKLAIGTYGSDSAPHDIPIPQTNFVREPATRCPKP